MDASGHGARTCTTDDPDEQTRSRRQRVSDTKAQTTKGKVLWHFTMSLDTVVAGSNHETDWMAGTNRSGLSGSKSQSEGVPC